MKRRFTIVALAWSAALLMVPASAIAGDTVCTGTLTGTFDNVVVPERQFCFLADSLVRGNVKALRDSQLIAVNDRIRGNVEGDYARAVIVDRSTVHGNIHITGGHDPFFLSAAVFDSLLPNGNIQIEKGLAPNGDWNVQGNTVKKGNIIVVENRATFFSSLVGNTVAGNVQVFKNRGTAVKDVTGNIVHQNLQCEENRPPFIGQPNAVGGSAEGQCGSSGPATSSALRSWQAYGVALRKYTK
jgi:hypothetical protein